MKRTVIALALCATVLVGCAAEEPKATPKDKENIDKVLKEGIGAPQDSQKGAEQGGTVAPTEGET